MTNNPAAPQPAWLKRHWGLLIVLAVVLLMAGVRLRTRDSFLERDEGEYAYAGQLMLQGIPPYEMAYNMKFPGTYAAYAAIMAVFGQTPEGIKIGLLCLTSLTAILLYWLGRRIIDETAGAMAGITCALLSASPSLFGMAGHATHFVAFFVTAGACLLWPSVESIRLRRLFAAGLFFGMAVLMKQHAAIFALWGVALLVFANRENPRPDNLKVLAVFSLGVVVPFVLTCLFLWGAGVLPQFWFWTITYAREYVSVMPLATVPTMLHYGFMNAIYRGWFLWIIGGIGLILTSVDPRLQKNRLSLVSFTIASFLTTCPGFFFRAHYFIVMVPAVALLAGCAVSSVGSWLQSKSNRFPRLLWPSLAMTLTVAAGTFENRDVWFQMPPFEASRNLYLINPFPEAATVAQYIRTNSSPSDTIAVLGSEPEIYFLSHRHSATGYIYTYPLMEPQPYAKRMQEQMIEEIERAKPRFIISVDCEKSWLPRRDSDTTIFSWWKDSYQANYNLVGLAEILSLIETRYTWGPEAAAQFASAKGNALIVYERKQP